MTDDDASLKRILQDCRVIAVVGLSADPLRPSHYVAKYMHDHGYRIVPVNPLFPELLGERSYPRLEDIPFAVDMVDVFRREEEIAGIARSAVAIGARCLWQQMGLRSLEGDKVATEAGLHSVWDRCVKVEHARLLG